MPYPEPLEALVLAFERFPGVGRRSAERMAFHVLRDPSSRDLARAIEHALARTLRCGRCCNVAESDPCSICADPKPKRSTKFLHGAQRYGPRHTGPPRW